MGAITLWFILTNGMGYLAPMEIPVEALACNFDGAVVGVQIDSRENPQIVSIPAPGNPAKHCRIDVGDRVVGLVEGEYHFATTEMGDGSSKPFAIVDPHTSVYWLKSNAPTGRPPQPTGFRLKGQP